MSQTEKEKGWFRWKIPLLVTVLCLAWEVTVADQIDIALNEILLFKGAFTFIGVGIFYNWLMDWLKNNHGKKMSKIELILTLPFFAFIIFALVPPFMYVRRWLLTVGLLVMGYEFWAFGLGYWFQETHLKKICTTRVTAVVLGNVQARTDNRPGEVSTKTYFPVLAYEANGQRLEMQYEHGQPRPMEVNRQVEICYNPQNIEEFCFLDMRENKALTIGVPFMLIIATAILVAAVLSIIFQWNV